MNDTPDTPPESVTFADVTSDDIRPGETPAQAKTRRKTEANRARRAAARAANPPAPRAPKPDAPPAPEPRPVGRPPGSTKAAKRQRGALVTLKVTAAGVAMVNAEDAQCIKDGAPALAAALATAAESNPKLAKVLDMLDMGGNWSDVAIAAGAIVIPILANHGLFGLGETPAPVEVERDAFGTVAPMVPQPAAPQPAPFVIDGAVPPEYVHEPWNMPFAAKPS